MQGLDWVGNINRVPGLSFLVIFAYFNTGAGASKSNHQKFMQILECKKTINLPTILIGDFNMTKQELEKLGWHSLFNGFCLVPDVSYTCNSPTGTRIIDYALVTNDLMGLVNILGYFDITWGPHIGLLLTVSKKPKEHRVLQACAPKPLPNLLESRKNKDFVETITEWEKRIFS